MDNLLKGETFNFFIDEIYLMNFETNNDIYKDEEINILFGAVLIPNINSSYFPPLHLRRFTFTPDFLSRKYYEGYREKIPELSSPDIFTFKSSIVEGNYYEIPSRLFLEGYLPELLTPNFNDILNEYKFDSPFSKNLRDIKQVDLEEGLSLLNITPSDNEEGKLLIYCFNVGQGDSTLIIFPDKNVYIVDTNIYSGKRQENYIKIVRHILLKNGLSPDKIKALVITHKHLDHLRGADKLIKSDIFHFDYFLINSDYRHDTNVVSRLLGAAREKITNHINVNKQGTFQEGKVKVTIINPKHDTCNNSVCKDLNDTSIVLLLQYGETNILLSGDAGYNVINNVFQNTFAGENFIKISHHGSSTGTNQELLSKIQPRYAYISAGNHKGFKHPHSDTVNLLNDSGIDYDLSREDGSIVYMVNESNIERVLFSEKKI